MRNIKFLFEFENFPDEVKERCQIVILSGVSEKDTIEKVLKNKAVKDFIPKPITSAALSRLKISKSYAQY